MTKRQTSFTGFRLPDQLMAQLKERAEREGRPISALLREAVEEWQSSQEASNMRNEKTKEILSALDFLQGDLGKSTRQPSAAGMLIKEADSQPVWRNGRYYPRGLNQIRAEQAVKAKEKSGMYTKQMPMGVVPAGIKTFQELDEYRLATQASDELAASASDLLGLVGNITGDPEIEAKGEALKVLVAEFAARLDQVPAKAKDKAAGEALAKVKQLALMHEAIDALKAIL